MRFLRKLKPIKFSTGVLATSDSLEKFLAVRGLTVGSFDYESRGWHTLNEPNIKSSVYN